MLFHLRRQLRSFLNMLVLKHKILLSCQIPPPNAHNTLLHDQVSDTASLVAKTNMEVAVLKEIQSSVCLRRSPNIAGRVQARILNTFITANVYHVHY